MYAYAISSFWRWNIFSYNTNFIVIWKLFSTILLGSFSPKLLGLLDSTKENRLYIITGIVFMQDYRVDRQFLDAKDSSAAGMQGNPQGLDDITDGQAEERFFQ